MVARFWSKVGHAASSSLLTNDTWARCHQNLFGPLRRKLYPMSRVQPKKKPSGITPCGFQMRLPVSQFRR